MGYELPTVKEGWAMLPQPCKVALGWVVVMGVTLAILEHYAKPLVEQWKDLQHAEESPFEVAQNDKDAQRAGDPYQVVYDDQSTRVLLFDKPADVLTVQWWQGSKTRLWKIHPETYGAPPTLDLAYGEVPAKGAGFLPTAGQCAPASECLRPDQHPGTYRVGSQAQLDQCWYDRRLKWFNNAGWSDACILAVPYNACGNYYSWQQAKWLCCDYH